MVEVKNAWPGGSSLLWMNKNEQEDICEDS